MPSPEMSSNTRSFSRLLVGGVLLIVGLLAIRWWAGSDLAAIGSEDQQAAAKSLLDGVLVACGLLAGVLVTVAGWMQRRRESSVNLDELFAQLATAEPRSAAALLQAAGVDQVHAARAAQRLSKGDQPGLDHQRRALEHLAQQLTGLREALEQSREQIQATEVSSREGRDFFVELGQSLDSLSRGTEETSSSILEMVAINNEVGENIHNLTTSVQETTTAIEEMTFSVKEVARNVEELSTAAEETAASMNQMDVSIGQVESNANETARLSETVTGDAERGVTAINRTIEGIDRIKDSSRSAAEVIRALGERIDEIGNILTVIDDVAEQTNLLALNAAIIAAQAGEHGRGFAVVADEIKALAERTGASTKEIADLIKTVQSESRNAVTTMNKGVDAVEEGVVLGHDAETALRKILESAKRSTLMIKAIAQATVEQSKGSKQVANAISRIAETVQQIALATSEQAKGAEQMMKSAERMRSITQHVERSTEEQSRGGRQITDSVEAIRDLGERLQQSAKPQGQHAQQLTNLVGRSNAAHGRGLELLSELERRLGETTNNLERPTP